jgi:hypothetical protein
MKHRVTRTLFDYWDAVRGARPAPDRCDIDPGAIRSCLASTFILTCDARHGHPFRIAGTSLCEMFGSELTRRPFDRLWAAEDRPAMSDLVRTVARDTKGLVAEVIGQTADAETADLEMILLPLAGGDTGTGRILGALAALSAPYWLGTRPLQSLHLGDLRHPGASRDDTLAPDQGLFRARALSSAADSRIPRNRYG